MSGAITRPTSNTVTRVVVDDMPGRPLKLALRSEDGAPAALDLDDAEAVRLATRLLDAVSRRLARAPGTPLPDPKHERFAMLRASGCSQADAYTAVGYRPDQSSSSKWERRHPLVRIRAAEIRAAMAAAAHSLRASPIHDLDP